MIHGMMVKIYADGADRADILRLYQDDRVKGFTTNPTLMRQAGITEYARFAAELLERVTVHPVSFEVFADDVEDIRGQAKLIASWGENVYVKIPVTTTKGSSKSTSTECSSEGALYIRLTTKSICRASNSRDIVCKSPTMI